MGGDEELAASFISIRWCRGQEQIFAPLFFFFFSLSQ
jgi:hypothetical protein